MNRFLLGGIGSSFLGLVVYVVGIATTGWLSQADPESGARADVGLWKTCLTGSGLTICTAYPDISRLPSATNAIRAFAVIGALLLFAGLALACFAAKKNSNNAKKIGSGMIIAAGLCGAIAAAIFAGKTANAAPGVSSLFGYSFYLTWVQTVFTVGGGAAIIYSGRSDEEDEIPMVR